jgi:hypothetical protein
LVHRNRKYLLYDLSTAIMIHKTRILVGFIYKNEKTLVWNCLKLSDG